MLTIGYVVSTIVLIVVSVALVADMASGNLYLSYAFQKKLAITFFISVCVAIFCSLKGL